MNTFMTRGQEPSSSLQRCNDSGLQRGRRTSRRLVCLLAGLTVGLALISPPTSIAHADPATFGTVQTLRTGWNHTMITDADNNLWAWGNNLFGTVGDDTNTSRLSPIKVLDNVSVFAGGFTHSLAVQGDGSLWAWGCSNDQWLHQCDWWSRTDDSVWKPLKTNDSGYETGNANALAAGNNFSLAIKDDGTLMGWGLNGYGQLGDDTKTNRDAPVPVDIPSTVTAVAAGSAFALAIAEGGTLYSWGDGYHGDLGNNGGAPQNTPYPVNGMTNVKTITAGRDFGLAVKNDGTLWAWGDNSNGQLGDGTTSYSLVPEQVNIDNVAAVAAGVDGFTLALQNDGTLWAWGDNGYGQLGDGTTTSSLVPEKVMTGVQAIAAGLTFSVAIKTDGTLMAWGDNSYGQLGDGSTTMRLTPVPITGSTAATSVTTLPSIHLVKGKSATIPAAVQPANATDRKYTWTSANTSIATVDPSTGKVTASTKAAGKSTTITVTSSDGSYTAKCKVYVVSKTIKMKSFTISPSKATGLLIGKTLQVKAKFKPSNATGIVPKFSSSNTYIATIDKTGVITTHSPGKTTIKVSAGGKTKKFVLTVGLVAASKITLNKTSTSITRGKTVVLKVVSWLPAGTNPQTIAWTTSNSKVATVSSSGKVTGKKKGKVTITAKTWNGKTAKCIVTVK